MRSPCAYGFAALNPSVTYPRFGAGLKLDHIPADFLMPETAGFQLLRFLEQTDQGWERSATTSEIVMIDGLLSCGTEPEVKAISTYSSRSRIPMVTDGLVQIMETVCHVASDAIVKLVLGSPGQKSELGSWVDAHRSVLEACGGIVYTTLRFDEVTYVVEEPTRAIGLRNYLEAADKV